MAGVTQLRTQVLGNHLRVWREDGRDGISWDELQQAKNDAWGEHATAVEIYPPQDEMVNEANMRHLWLIEHPEKLPSLYRRGEKEGCATTSP